MRNFENWETEDVETAFNLDQLRIMPLLEAWLKSTTTLSEYEAILTEYLRNKLLDNADFWNEDELKLQFIAPLLLVVNFDMPRYKIFSQRTLTATVNGIDIGGRVDFMLAKGKQRPSQPYFFIHEYKQERKGASDPKGQLLAELVAAQARNELKHPIYGCYVVGRNWFFVILDNDKYAVTNALNASDNDILKIIAMLRYVKTEIEK
jgi:hypothetical protein